MKNFFNFKKLDNKILITNDLGRYALLEEWTFHNLVYDELKLSEDIREKFRKDYFIYDVPKAVFARQAGEELRKYKSYLFSGTTLHIFILTKNCNQNCVYCQASANQSEKEMMTETIAKRAVDIALSSPNKYLTFEFQGGEPLMNFQTLRFIVEYTETISLDKIIYFNLVSNLTILTDEMLDFLNKHNVNISTSLDGNEKLHNINRPMAQSGSYNKVLKGINKVRRTGKNVSSIQTTTKYSLNQYKEIINEYVNLQLHNISLRPLTRLGYAGDNWDTIGYSADEFLNFYKKSLEYLIEVNRQGYYISESITKNFLSKILKNFTANYMELRSPCGAGIGQLAYYYNGDIFTCDEARMLAEMGQDDFKLGNVYNSTLKDLIENPVCKSTSIASCLENLSDCKICVYSPYCGTCPVISFALYKTLLPDLKEDFRCKINKGILDILFKYISDNDLAIMKILESWVM